MTDSLPTRAFYSCYLLTSLHARYKHHTYIGFAVDPARRLRQHNGELVQGAKRTKRRRPWQMVCVVHGFRSKNAALRFEWAWQHPHESLAVRDAANALGNIGALYKLRAKITILYTMLNLPPWCRQPLAVHWLSDEHMHWLRDCPQAPDNVGYFFFLYRYSQLMRSNDIDSISGGFVE